MPRIQDLIIWRMTLEFIEQNKPSNQFQIFDFAASIPNEFFYMLPYVLTLFVLIGAVGKSRAPKALGEHYEVGKR